MTTISTPIKQRETAKKAAAAKAKKPVANADIKADHKQKAAAIKKEKAATPPKPKRDRSRWSDATGHVIEKGVKVKHDGKIVGVAKYLHSHYEKDADGNDIKSKPFGMVGVELTGKGDLAKIGGRTVKNRSFRADQLTAVPE